MDREDVVTLMMETAALFFGTSLLKATVANPTESVHIRNLMYKVYDALLAKGIIRIEKAPK